jgi:hypothetical protein
MEVANSVPFGDLRSQIVTSSRRTDRADGDRSSATPERSGGLAPSCARSRRDAVTGEGGFVTHAAGAAVARGERPFWICETVARTLKPPYGNPEGCAGFIRPSSANAGRGASFAPASLGNPGGRPGFLARLSGNPERAHKLSGRHQGILGGAQDPVHAFRGIANGRGRFLDLNQGSPQGRASLSERRQGI